MIVETVLASLAWKAGLPTAASTAIYAGMRLCSRTYRRRLLTSIVDKFRVVYDRDTLTRVRTGFRFVDQTDFVSREGVSNHAHPAAASSRCQATTSADVFIKQFERRKNKGGQPKEPQGGAAADQFTTQWQRFDVATSSREKKFKVAGERQFYDTSDFAQTARSDRLKKNHFVTMIDVDFHLDDWSRFANNPVACYTRIPDDVAGPTTDGHYRLQSEDGKVKMVESIHGGATWKSGLWDYSSDRVIVRGAWGISHTLSAVEKIPQPGHPGRYMVFIVPIARIWMPRCVTKALAWLLQTPLHDNYPELSHAKNVWPEGQYVLGRFTRAIKAPKGGVAEDMDVVCVRNQSQQDGKSYEMAFDTFSGLLQETMRDTKANNLATVEARMRANRQSPRQLETGSAYAWANFFKATAGVYAEPMMVNYVVDADFEDAEAVQEDGKPVAALAAAPLSIPGVSPTDCSNNDISCVRERIQKVRNSTEPAAKYVVWAAAFVEHIERKLQEVGMTTDTVDGKKVTTIRLLNPVTAECIIEQQKRPAQRMRNELYLKDGRADEDRVARVKAFMKKEVYADAKAPRNISTVATTDTINLGRYTYPMKAFLQVFDWYVPGSTPEQTANLIHAFCKDRPLVAETDYSKFDGSLSPFLRELERSVMLKCFAKPHRAELARLLARDHQVKGRTKKGHRYETKASRLSGSQMTTVGNSIVNAFVAYCALRATGLSSSLAFSKIGPKFGDDGLDEPVETFHEVAENLGLGLKMDVRKTDRYVTFCGRVYLAPRHFNHSIFNPKKAIRSLPICMKGSQHADKVNGYLAVDPLTPLVADYASAIKRVNGYGDDVPENYETIAGPYPYDVLSEPLAVEVIAELMNTTSDAIRDCIHHLKRATTRHDLENLYRVFFPNDEQEELKGVRRVPEDTENVVRHTDQNPRNLEEPAGTVNSPAAPPKSEKRNSAKPRKQRPKPKARAVPDRA